MNKKVVMCAVVAALGGFLFGFDTVVISGAEQTIQKLWGLSPALHGWTISAALWGTVLGSLIGGWPTECYGRKKRCSGSASSISSQRFGLAESAALLQSVGVGITNLIFTFVGLWLIDRLGRHTLLTIGSFGYIASLGLCSWSVLRLDKCDKKQVVHHEGHEVFLGALLGKDQGNHRGTEAQRFFPSSCSS